MPGPAVVALVLFGTIVLGGETGDSLLLNASRGGEPLLGTLLPDD